MPFCKAAIPELSRTWSAPTAPKDGGSIYKYAFLSLTFSDIASPPAADVANHFAAGDMKTYMDGAMNGCGDYTMDPFEVPLGFAQKSGDVCAIAHSSDVPALTVANFDPSAYDTIVLMLVTTIDCATSGGLGSTTHTINGIGVTFTQLFMSVWTSELTATACPSTYQFAWMCPLRSSQTTMLHELVHSLGLYSHANAYVCLDEPSDTTSCQSTEYKDLFDIMGSGSFLLGLSARSRYYLGWFGSDEVLGVTSAGTYTIRAIGLPSDGVASGSTAIKRAAFVRTPSGSAEADGVWVEFVGGASDAWGTADDGSPVDGWNSEGLFLRKEGSLIDAKRQLCTGSYADTYAWEVAELQQTTLNAGGTYLDQSTGIRLSEVSVAADGGSVSFKVEYEAVDTTCRRDYPRISEGLFGEYYVMVDGASPGSDIQLQARWWVDALKPHVSSSARYGFFRASYVQDLDAGCAAANFALDVAELPAGWGKVSYWPDVEAAGVAMYAGTPPYRDFGFALSIPADAADGDYDMCVLAYNMASGLQTAKPFRVTLPEGNWVWYQNNRPGQYAPLPANDCSAYVGCRAGVAGCAAPAALLGICAREAGEEVHLVRVEMVAEGSVSDYSEATRLQIAAAVATEAGVDASDVTVAVEAASVRLVVDVAMASASSSADAAATLQTSMGTPEQATAVLSAAAVVIIAAPAIASVVSSEIVPAPSPPPPSVLPPPAGPADSGGSNIGIIIAGAAGGSVALVVAVVIVAVVMRKRNQLKIAPASA